MIKSSKQLLQYVWLSLQLGLEEFWKASQQIIMLCGKQIDFLTTSRTYQQEPGSKQPKVSPNQKNSKLCSLSSLFYCKVHKFTSSWKSNLFKILGKIYGYQMYVLLTQAASVQNIIKYEASCIRNRSTMICPFSFFLCHLFTDAAGGRAQ